MERRSSGEYGLGKVLGRLIDNVRLRDKGLFGLFVLYTLVAGVYPFFAVVLPKLLLQELTSPAGAQVGNILIIVGGYLLIAGSFVFAKNVISGSSYPRMTALRIDYLRDIGRKLLGIEYKYIEDSKFYDENERALSAGSNNQEGIEGVYHKMFEVPAEIVTALVLTVFIGILDWRILLALLINAAAVVVIARKVHQFGYARRTEKSHAERRVEYYKKATHDFSYGKDIRLYGFRERILDNFAKEIAGYKAVNAAIAANEFRWGLLGLLTLLISDVATYGLLIYKTVQGMSIADFSMYLAAVASLTLMLRSISEKVSFIVNEGQVVRDFFELLDRDIGEKGGNLPAVSGDTLQIEFCDVSFKYPGTDRWILRHFDFKIGKGERLAIVGINGAGKSTIVKLMTGLFAPTEGDILINGSSISEYDTTALYSMFSVVFQDVDLLHFTVAENIACSSVGIDRQRVDEVLRRVGMYDKIYSDKRGIDRMVHKTIDPEGAEFSGGEAQKLMIARALYKDACMVIMDEPTAALDALAEAEIYEQFGSLVSGKTAVYISHRLASTKFCDRIAFFDGDGLKEYGSHEELMKLGGEYCNMFTVQGKYYREGGADGE